jgi:hypothetical protein
VEGNAIVEGGIIFGEALVTDSAKVRGNALIYGNAIIAGNALVEDMAKVCDYCRVNGNARIANDTHLHIAVNVTDKVEMVGFNEIYGDYTFKGNMRFVDIHSLDDVYDLYCKNGSEPSLIFVKQRVVEPDPEPEPEKPAVEPPRSRKKKPGLFDFLFH